MKFNLNDTVKIKLTPKGREILTKRDYLRFVKEDSEGWSSWQMHQLFSTFGEHIYLGCTPPFELDIEITIKE